MKRCFCGKVTGIVLVAVLILGSTAVLGFAMGESQAKADNQVVVNPISNNNHGVAYDIPVLRESNTETLTGMTGAFLLVDSISEKEYADMMNILYPSGIIDEQGLDISSADNLEELRARFIAEHTKAYSFSGTGVSEVQVTPFNITLESHMDGKYECLFYQAIIGEDCFVYPSEWGNQSCSFVTAGEIGIYLAYTDIGIWQIDPHGLTARKITSDTYAGKSRSEIRDNFISKNGYLFWIDSVQLSPDGEFAVYRTNRDCIAGSDDTSVWAVNLQTGEERQVAAPTLNNDIAGFLSDSHIAVGALADTRIINVETGGVVPLEFPQLPNFLVTGACNGIIVYSSYSNGSSDTTAYISSIDVSTGKLTPITKVVGYLSNEPRFSLSGKTAAIGYGTDPMVGTTDVMLVNLETGTQKLLTASVANSQDIDGMIRNYQWAHNDTIIVNAQRESESHIYLIAPTA